MVQQIGEPLADEDYQLININKLGSPLAVYKMKSFYLHSLFIMGVCFLILGFTILALDLYENLGSDEVYFAMYIGLALLSFIVGIFVFRVELPRSQNYQIIVCEHGLLETKGQPPKRKFAIVYWKNVQTIRKLYNGYTITQRGHDTFTLTALYEHAKELAAYIKLRSSLPTHAQQAFTPPEEMYPPLREKPPE